MTIEDVLTEKTHLLPILLIWINIVTLTFMTWNRGYENVTTIESVQKGHYW